MTEDENATMETIQAVVDRIAAYQDGAPAATIGEELRKGFAESGVDVAPEQVEALAEAIDRNNGDVNAQDVLAQPGS